MKAEQKGRLRKKGKERRSLSRASGKDMSTALLLWD